jgi:hypothetical protein
MASKNIAEKTELDEQLNTEETKKVTSAKKTTKKFAPDEAIECRSVTGGELILVGAKTKFQYTWADYGDTAYVEYQDLQALQSRKSGFLTKPRFIIEDKDIVEQWGAMLKPIYSQIEDKSIEDMFRLSPDRFRAKISKVPNGIKDSIKTKAAQMIAAEELNDIRIIKIIDEVLGTEFTKAPIG